ncbi:hypothetical protein LOD50_10550 [Xylella fastidiosa subsp. multiplex]|uniref:Uncharacterized protein n=1 Tax=Xylella fastidiosa subsp. multiplex TaxID=644357 RepID=A0AAW6HVX1_XYLFS|nr:hypothetical protein [Xylella fastidiosa]MDC6408594.1 hypothetical protein [Xylella fastidiosa subsp. multiplex]MDD0936811.1 hypothetical protein [Xylella fastidiosa subsp. multiplex]
MSTLTNASEKTQPIPALSGTQKAPLFYWDGIRDEEGAELQPAIYSLISPRDPNSAIKVSCLDRPLPLFSDLVCRCFVVRFDSEDRSCHYFIVDSSHPQYEQARKAYSDRVWSLPSIYEIKAMAKQRVSLAKATGSDEVAASETKKAPLFCLDGIRDDKNARLQEAFYVETLDGEILICGCLPRKFSPLVRSWFERSPYSSVKAFRHQRRIFSYRIDLGPVHPLYPQVKAAYEAKKAHSNSIFESAFEAAKKGSEDASKEVAA